MRKNSDLYNRIMEQVAKEVKRSLNEVDDIAPIKQEVSGEVYLVRCDGVNKKLLDVLSKKLPAFDNYGSGSIRVTCKTHEEVIKVISLLVNEKVLDVDNSLGQAPRISIQKVNKNSVNDSVNESFINEEKGGRAVAHAYIPMNNIKVPRQRAKLDIIMKINSGELERTPEAIKFAMMETGLWDDRSEGQIQMDVNLIMRKTDIDTKQEEMEGDFTTDFTYSRYADDDEWEKPMDAAENHVKYLMKHGLDVSIEKARYSYLIHIHYYNRQQFEILVRWFAWHMGLTDTQNNPCPRSKRQYVEDIIKSGKKTVW